MIFSLFYELLLFMCVHVCVYMCHTCSCAHGRKEIASDSPGAGVTGSYKPPGQHAGNRTLVFWKSSTYPNDEQSCQPQLTPDGLSLSLFSYLRIPCKNKEMPDSLLAIQSNTAWPGLYPFPDKGSFYTKSEQGAADSLALANSG